VAPNLGGGKEVLEESTPVAPNLGASSRERGVNMKVPYKWLLEYVDIDKSINEVADALTLSGSKVEEVITSGKEIDRVVTGKLLEIKKHPEAHSLVICQVDVKDEVVQIVTGANNITEGDVVPVALHGSSLPGGVKIKKGKLRGIESNGMLCSEEELGVADENSVHGIMILPQDTAVGLDIKELIGLDGGVIDFEITSNRSDCYGVYGIARETAATFGVPLKRLETFYKDGVDDINNHLKVDIQDNLCRRYIAKMVKNVKIQESPDWMQEKLLEAGVRPINNIVDITNYIMIELGQPMHAFDYRYVGGKKIIVRLARGDEKFVTLDRVERKLNSSMLVIADADKSVAIAGVMGGENSEIKEDTSTVIFEFANFNGPNIRLTSKKLGLRTDASGKFEKDLDPELAELALNRACFLVEQLGAGEIVGGIIDVYKEPQEKTVLTVSAPWISKFLGIEVSTERTKEILESLEMQVNVHENDILNITVPSFRQDIRIKEDIAEEVCRIYGYDKIPPINIKGEAVEAIKTKEQKLTGAVKEVMTASGLYESITYSFVSPRVFNNINLPEEHKLRKTVVVSNPLGEDFSIMRTTIIPSMLDCLGKNYAKDNKEVRLFEVAKAYIPVDAVLPDEREMLSVGMYGEVDFYTLKGVIENLLVKLGIEKAEFVADTENPSFHPGRCAKLLVRKKEAGILGEIHPDVAHNYGMDNRVYIAEIDLYTLYEASKLERKYKVLPKFPAVSRDLAMLVKDEITVGEIENIIGRAGKELLESVKLFDVYKGKQVEEGLKSVAYSLVYRNNNKTLTDDEVNVVHDKIVKALTEKLKAVLR
jgi:phenylalanyl-tRNA synthetase beta chain